MTYGPITATVPQLTYDIDAEFNGDPNNDAMTLYAEIRLHWKPAGSGGQFILGKSTAGVFSSKQGSASSYNVAQVFYIPVCTLNLSVPTSSRTITSVSQLQYGGVPLTLNKTNLYYSKGETTGTLRYTHVNNYIGADNTGSVNSIEIPFSTSGASVYHYPTQFSDPDALTLTAGVAGDDGVLLARISTDHNGDIRYLDDFSSYAPWRRDFLEDTIITDKHNSLP